MRPRTVHVAAPGNGKQLCAVCGTVLFDEDQAKVKAGTRVVEVIANAEEENLLTAEILGSEDSLPLGYFLCRPRS
jgi:hypothetical protein